MEHGRLRQQLILRRVPTPTIDGYTSALVNNPTTSDVPAKTVTADRAGLRRSSCLQSKTITN